MIDRLLRVLAIAYACEPGRGSEPAAGWGLTRAVADRTELTALVGASHADGLAAWRRANPNAPGRYVPVAEPRWARRLPRTRTGWFLRYLAWLSAAAEAGRRLHREQPFDVVWHCSYATYWLPSPADRIGPPVLLGPVGGAVTTPPRLWPLLGLAGVPAEVAERVAVRLAARLPATRRTLRAATRTIVQNHETRAAVQDLVRGEPVVLNHALFAELPAAVPSGAAPAAAPPGGADRHPGYVLHLSRLESRKVPALPLRALATTPPHVRLVFAGDGPARASLERLVARLGLASRVTFLGRVPHAQVAHLIADAAAVVFTGLREEGGIALAETLLAGTPAIVLASGGARTIAEAATDRGRVAIVDPGSVSSTVTALAQAMTRFTEEFPRPRRPLLDVDAAREELLGLLREVAATTAPRGPAASG